MQTPKFCHYTAPLLECEIFYVERGFAFSLEDPEVDNEQDW